jgi:hypothetical protein
MLLYLARVNEHAVLRMVGSKRWSVTHFLRTIQSLFELPSSLLSNLMAATARAVKAFAAGKNGITSSADYSLGIRRT